MLLSYLKTNFCETFSGARKTLFRKNICDLRFKKWKNSSRYSLLPDVQWLGSVLSWPRIWQFIRMRTRRWVSNLRFSPKKKWDLGNDLMSEIKTKARVVDDKLRFYCRFRNRYQNFGSIHYFISISAEISVPKTPELRRFVPMASI